MNAKLKLSALALLSIQLIDINLFAQTSGPAPPPPMPPPPPGLPVDGGLIFLFVIALLFGVYKSFKLSKKIS